MVVQLPTVSESDAWIAKLIDGYRPGHALSQPFYTDERVFRRDMERVIFRHWQVAGHVSQIPSPGDYFLHEIGGESVIVWRGQDGQVRSFFNVCRHRGSRVCLTQTGNARAAVCPYHAWTYADDGRLLSAKAMPEGFDPSGHGLRPCATQVMEGLILVCMSGDPPDITAQTRGVSACFEMNELATAKVGAVFDCTVRANWKLVLENFGECYHCSHTHPEYCQVMAHAVPDSWANKTRMEEYAGIRAQWEARARELGHPVRSMEKLPGVPASAGRMPIGPGYLSQTMDGRPAAPLMGRFKAYDGGFSHARIYPAIYLLATNDFVLIPRFIPVGPVHTRVVFTWYVRPDARPGIDFDPDRLSHVYRVTTEQDKKIVEDNQAGVESISYEPGPYSVTEQGIVGFIQWYFQQIR